jgi:hypothetical protein
LGIKYDCLPDSVEIASGEWASERGLLSIEEGGLNDGSSRRRGGGDGGDGGCAGRHVGSSCLSCCCRSN